MKNKLRYFWLLCAAALGWWSGAGLDYVAGQVSQAEPEERTIETMADSSDRSSSPGPYSTAQNAKIHLDSITVYGNK